MNQRIMIIIEEHFNQFCMQLNLPVGAPWCDAFTALEKIVQAVKDMAAKDQEKQEQVQKENNTENQEVIAEVTESISE